MSPARRTGLLICNSLFRFMLLASVSLAVFNISLRMPKLIKTALVETDAYKRFVPAVIAANLQNQQAGSIPLDDPKVQAIANRDFSPALLQKNTELFVDSMYDWLEGKTYQPHFRIDFSAAKIQFANDIGTYAVQRLSALPICKTNAAVVTLDAFQATCLPKGVELAGENQEVAAEITGSGTFLPKTVFTANDLPKSAAGDTITEQLALAPIAYRLAYSLMWLSIGFTLVLGAGMVLLRPSRWVGWHTLGIAILSDGAFLAISTLLFGRLLPQLTSSFQVQFSGASTNAILNDVIQHISGSIETLLINVGIQVAAVGAVVVAAERFFRPSSPFVGLEKLTGIVTGIHGADDGKVHLVAADVPIQSSEKDTIRHRQHPKKSAVEEEIA